MFLSKRNGIYYLWYRNDAGNKHKVGTVARVRAGALHFPRTFDQESRHRRDQRILLSSFTKDPFEYVQSHMTIGTLRICEGAFHHFLRLHGSGMLSACQWLNKLTNLALAPRRGPVIYIIRARYERALGWVEETSEEYNNFVLGMNFTIFTNNIF